MGKWHLQVQVLQILITEQLACVSLGHSNAILLAHAYYFNNERHTEQNGHTAIEKLCVLLCDDTVMLALLHVAMAWLALSHKEQSCDNRLSPWHCPTTQCALCLITLAQATPL